MRALAVLGVNTGVGKTHVAAMLLRGLQRVRELRVAPFKPLESGVELYDGVPQDAQKLLEASGRSLALDAVCPWQLPRPVAPADELERLDIRVSLDDIEAAAHRLVQGDDKPNLLFEGAGGVLSPLTWAVNGTHVAKRLDAGVWLVAKDELGALSQILVNIEVLRARGLHVMGVVLNRFPNEDSIAEGKNAAALQRLGLSKVWRATEDFLDASVVAESSVWYRQR